MLQSDPTEFLLALGSNVSDDLDESFDLVESAIVELYNKSIKCSNKSKYYKTPAFPAGSGPDFINCALSVETDFSPLELLENLHEIEAKLGRKREKRWAQRAIDIDLLAYGEMVAPNLTGFTRWLNLPLEQQMQQAPEQLILPHPRLQDRAFVLVPLADIAPDWRHPVLGKTTCEMLNELPKQQRDEITEFVTPS